MSKSSFPNKRQVFYKSVLTSKLIFSKLYNFFLMKFTYVFLMVFVTKRTYWIWVFLAFKPRRYGSTISDKIRE